MRYVAAYLLATLGGNNNPCKGDVEKILCSVGLDVDDDKLAKPLQKANGWVVRELDGKDINAVIAEGSAKLASMPSGGAAASTSAGGGAGGGGEAAAEEKKEEKKEESEPESDDDMGFGLFD